MYIEKVSFFFSAKDDWKLKFLLPFNTILVGKKGDYVPSECDKKEVRMCIRNVVPVPIEPSMPRRDQTEGYVRYCRLMLMLFKPWRVVSDLREPAQLWETTFEAFCQTMNSAHKCILNNMHVLNECRDSCNDHMQTRTRLRKRGLSEPLYSSSSQC